MKRSDAKNAAVASTLFEIDPLLDSRWSEFILRHPDSSIFHAPAWFTALQATYGYTPVAFTTTPHDAALTNGICFSHVKSWYTGARLVSNAFADHCHPLIKDAEDLMPLLQSIPRQLPSGGWEYAEIRALRNMISNEERYGFGESNSFNHHTLDLRPDLSTLFEALHDSCVKRKIRRAERERLRYEKDKSEEALRKFYTLFVPMRRRHGVVPPPFRWFVNLATALRDDMQVRLVYHNNQAIASVVTLRFKDTMTYKYGCSDPRFHNLGPMPLLFWHIIREAKELGLKELDLGRSDLDNKGLSDFKRHLGARCSKLTYYRYPRSYQAAGKVRTPMLAKRFLRYVPLSVCRAAGSLLYRHVG